MNIYQKMSAATEKINRVAKNLKVGVGQSQYKAVGEADVLEAVKPVEIELGIYSFPLSRKIVDTQIMTTKNEYGGKVSERNSLFMRIETVYRFVNVENPDEYIDITTFGDGVDSQDKAPGKAMTYSDKYALLKAYKIETGDDPDQKASEEGRFKKPKEDGGKERIDAIRVKALETKLEKCGVKRLQICKAYGVDSIEDLNTEQWLNAMKRLEATESEHHEQV